MYILQMTNGDRTVRVTDDFVEVLLSERVHIGDGDGIKDADVLGNMFWQEFVYKDQIFHSI